ncbi:DUF3040 domain-containing protein [Actinoplanes sp. NPDC051859]|uniref:DUF3040 domain-containing protein n=1 Tax=Actinoplanes sp. NPDC051859 TaxID=3363909 RepID=UPI00378C8B00
MLNERERRELAAIESGLQREDPRFADRMRHPGKKDPSLTLIAMIVVGWWLVTPLLATWWNVFGAVLVAVNVTAVAGIVIWRRRGAR